VRYADTLLASGEVVLRRGRQHWMALLLSSRDALLLWVAGIAAFFLGSVVVSPHSDLLATLLGYVALGLLLAGLALFLKKLWEWWAQDYLITNRRIVKVEGILNKRSADSSLEKISDAVLRQDLLARLMGYGDLDIVTAAESAIDRYHMLDRPSDFKRAMLNAKHSFEMEMRYREPPGPPIHAPQPRGGSGQAGSMQPRPAMPPAGPVGARVGGSSAAPDPSEGSAGAATHREQTPADTGRGSLGPARPASPVLPPATTSPAEILDVLARLADLRDRGAITAAEYEAKKAELLARL
jgi:hypothetical protein